MVLKRFIVLTGLVILIMATAQIVYAEEALVAPTDSVVIASNQQTSSAKDGDMQWAWGEVTNLDSQAKTITLKYLDYETDQEKELVLALDEKTTFENIKDLDGLALKDTLSIDYVIGADNSNIAKNISFEKPDAPPVVSSPAVENIPPPTLPSGPGQSVVDATGPAVSLEAPAPDLAPLAAQAETPVDLSMAVSPAPEPPEPAPVVQGQAQ